jgi:tryptophan synthase beta subunit
MKAAKRMRKNSIIIVNLSGRGDKDLDTVSKAFNYEL